MHRIVDREGGIPGFRTIRACIIREYGKEDTNTEAVVKEVYMSGISIKVYVMKLMKKVQGRLSMRDVQSLL